MKKKTFKCRDKEQLIAVLTYLLSKGWAYGVCKSKTLEDIRKNYSCNFENWLYLVFDVDNGIINADNVNIFIGYAYCPISIQDIFSEEFDLPQFEEIILNNENKAHVYKDKIVVGCQTFKIDVIDKLVEARNKIVK